MISLIVAMDEGGLIGRGNALPWRLPNDLKYFKQHTLGKTVLMGRKTWDSLTLKPLPQRDNWVLTRDSGFAAPGAHRVGSLDEVRAALPAGELMVIGGAELYRQTLPMAQRIYLTEVHASLEGDAWFPQWTRGDWRELSRERHAADERHAHAYSFVTLERA